MQHSWHYKENNDIGGTQEKITINAPNMVQRKNCGPSIKSSPLTPQAGERRPLGATVCEQCLHPHQQGPVQPELEKQDRGGEEGRRRPMGATVSEQCLHPLRRNPVQGHPEVPGPNGGEAARRRPVGATVSEQCLHPHRQRRRSSGERPQAPRQ